MKRGTKKAVNTIIIAVLVIGIIIAGYFTYVYSSTCEDEVCFQNALVRCKRTSFLKDSEETVILYRILGKRGDSSLFSVAPL